MKLKNLLIPTLLILAITGCGENTDFVGTYQNEENKHLLHIKKADEEGKKFYVSGKFKTVFAGVESWSDWTDTVYKKDNELLQIRSDELIGTIGKNKFTYARTGLEYKKKL